METRDYSSIYSIKDFALNELAPKYFDMVKINQLNIGLLGYVTELIANTTEDSFNAVSTYMPEIVPNKAIMPETLYSYAALYQVGDLFAKPAEMYVMLFVNESDINSMGLPKVSHTEFVLDSDMIIDIEGKQFMLDYDIIIQSKPYKNDHIYTAVYDLNYNNSLSDVVNPYIKTKRIKYYSNDYLALFVKVRQINIATQSELIINNDSINLPTVTFQFNDQLANFEVFYRSPESTSFIQLKKRLLNTTPIKDPFCYYKFKDGNKIEVSFTLRDTYFKPKFNSELMIKIVTTTGETGNFPLYTGDKISVIPKSEEYIYNNNIVVFAIVQSESKNGSNNVSLDEVKTIVGEQSSTLGSYTNENDLQLYFSKFSKNGGKFVKRRDDAFERLFSAFTIMRDNNSDIYSTNTLHTDLYPVDFDTEYEQSNKYLLKAGHLFKYKANSIDTAVIIPTLTVKDDFSALTDEFIYTNPFLMTVTKSPSQIVGFYLNSINDRLLLDYTYVNSDSLVQFICNNLYIKRNALNGENSYTLTIIVSPATELETPLIGEDNSDLGLLKLRGFIEDEGAETSYFDFVFKSFDVTSNLYTYEASITTDDYMTLNQKLRTSNLHNTETEVVETRLIPMMDCIINICSFYKYSDPQLVLPHKYNYLSDLTQYTLTNIYSANEKKANFITPINIMKSRLKYVDIDGTNYYMNVAFVPFVKAVDMKDSDKFEHFLSTLFSQYDYMQDITDRIINNYSIDMKFYNTYGKAKNFVAGNNEVTLDKVNCTISFKICPVIGAKTDTLIRDTKLFIKNYIESINNKGSNEFFVSNLSRELETKFSDIKYLVFEKINNYDSSVQSIQNKSTDINLLTKEERRNYVPEYLTFNEDDINIEII